jgi:hypothetical protein
MLQSWRGLHLVHIASWQAMSDCCSIATVSYTCCNLPVWPLLLCCVQDTEQLIAAGANQLEIGQRWEQQTQVQAAAALPLRDWPAVHALASLHTAAPMCFLWPKQARRGVDMCLLYQARCTPAGYSPDAQNKTVAALCGLRCRRRW